MVGTLKFNGDSRGIELAAPERRGGEQSEPSRSGGAANSRWPAAPPADTEVVAKAKAPQVHRRVQTGHRRGSRPRHRSGRDRLPVAARGAVLVSPGGVAATPRHRRPQRLVPEAWSQADPQPLGGREPEVEGPGGASGEETPAGCSHHRRSKKSIGPVGDHPAGNGTRTRATHDSRPSNYLPRSAALRPAALSKFRAPRSTEALAPPPEPTAVRPRPTPARALSETERQTVLTHLHSERFMDQAPAPGPRRAAGRGHLPMLAAHHVPVAGGARRGPGNAAINSGIPSIRSRNCSPRAPTRSGAGTSPNSAVR